MRNRLFVVEGLPCSGKSSTAAYLASLLEGTEKVCLVDEGTGDHPTDYEFHALAPAGLLSEEARIVPLAGRSGADLERLLPYKIYDGLPWEVEKPLMLDKWRQFVRERDPEAVYVFNCVLLQNPMCETMMRFGFPEEVSRDYIGQIVRVLEPLRPAVVYLRNSGIADAVTRAAPERPGWLEAVIDYHVNGAYGRSVGAAGFEGYIRCLEERQARELRILEGLPVDKLTLDDPQRDWPAARAALKAFLSRPGA